MIYFDNAATTLKKPASVRDIVLKAVSESGNPGRGAHSMARKSAGIVYNCRRSIANLFNCSPREISFMFNATDALNTAINGIVKSGDHIITSVWEHNSVLRPLYRLENMGVEIDFIKTDKRGVPDYESIKALIKPNTKAFVINHISNVTGNVTDLEVFKELKREYGIMLIVDGAQSAGTRHIDLRDIDVYCFTGHKGLMGLQGTGGLYCRQGVNIEPLRVGGSGIHSFDREHPREMPEALEAGTLNCHGLAALNESVNYILNEGADNIYNKERRLTEYFYERVSKIEGITIYGDFGKRDRGSVVSLNIGDMTSGEVCDILDREYNIAVRGGAHCAPLMHRALGTEDRGCVRFSFGYFNTFEEIDRATDALKSISDNGWYR